MVANEDMPDDSPSFRVCIELLTALGRLTKPHMGIAMTGQEERYTITDESINETRLLIIYPDCTVELSLISETKDVSMIWSPDRYDKREIVRRYLGTSYLFCLN